MRVCLQAAILLGSVLFGPASAEAESLQSISDAVARHPNRPGLKLRLARALLRAGDLKGAEALARTVLTQWPQSTRARLLLAAVARTRGENPTDDTPWRDASPIALRFLQPANQASAWQLGGRIGVQYDSRATPLVAVFGAPSTLGNDPAIRGVLSAHAGWRGGRWQWRLGVDRTVHGSTGEAEVGLIDRSAAWTGLDARWAGLGGSINGGIYMRGALIGRTHDGHFLTPGAHVGWRLQGRTAPWLRLDGLGVFGSQFADPLAAGRLQAGLTHQQGRRVWGVTAAGLRLGPGATGFLEGEGRISMRTVAGRWRPDLGAALAIRDDDRGLRPRAFAGLGWALARSWVLRLEGGWQRIEGNDRLLGGLTVEVCR